MKQTKSSSKRISKIHELLIIMLSITFSFTVFFFSPSELVIRNQKDFLINASHVIVTMFVAAFVVAAVSILLLNLLLLIHEKLFVFVSRILSGLLLALYIQGLLLNGKMTLLTGDAQEYDLPLWVLLLDLLCVYALLCLPLSLYFLKKKHPNVKLLGIGKGYALHYIMGLIFVMQLAGLFGTVAEFGLDKYDRTNNHYFSYEPSMSLSKENNIVVFLEDRMDSFYMDEALERYPDLNEKLDGFTFYQNNLSRYTYTFPSVTNMFTSELYTGEDWNEYHDRAWKNEIFLDELKRNDYHINLYFDKSVTYNSFDSIKDRCDSYLTISKDSYKVNYLGKDGIVPIMTKLSLNKLLPYFFKEILTKNIRVDFSVTFFRFDLKGLAPAAIGETSDLRYYDFLTKNGLTDDNPKNTFTFVHFRGAHDPIPNVSKLYSGKYASDSVDPISTLRGEFEIIFEYIRQMKELGIYDNSTIIILGDHGRVPAEVMYEGMDVLTSPIVTSLLIKPARAESGPLKFDPSSELSNNCFAASILEYAGIDHEKYGYSYSDIIENDIRTKRITENYETLFVSYEVTGDARDFDNWKLAK